MIHLFANLSNYISAAIAILYGIAYLIKPRLLDLHTAAGHRGWEDPDRGMRTWVLSLMRALGGAALAAGFVVIMLQHHFSASLQSWMPLTILVSGSFVTTGTLYAMLMVRTKTKGRPPIPLLLTSLVLIVIGYLLNVHLAKEI
jgi:hypothetical protein